ncbi:MAG: hypothetical protein H6738_21015 [Alphaproteobacteria bacterium]|nr:hypothetical protein [Alphaproteobacteria bacterium]MCB9699275.1 hypothetical protein [Alphaproteobacteria bacterium]
MRAHLLPPLLLLPTVACLDPATGTPRVDVEVWVADQGAGELIVWRSRDPGGADLVADAARLGDGFAPSAVAVDGDGLLVADFATGALTSLTTDGAVLGRTRVDPAQAVRLEEPCAVRVEGAHLLVLANDSRNLVELTRDGEVVRELGAERPLRSAHGFDLLDADLVIVASSPTTPDAGLLGIWDLATGDRVSDLARWPRLEEATDVLALDDGTVAVADWWTGTVSRWDPSTGERLEDLGEGLAHPVALDRGPDGAIWVLADDGAWRIGDDGAELEAPLALRWPRNLAVRAVTPAGASPPR